MSRIMLENLNLAMSRSVCGTVKLLKVKSDLSADCFVIAVILVEAQSFRGEPVYIFHRGTAVGQFFKLGEILAMAGKGEK